ncbi:MAG: ABC transporter permease [Ureaplasma sp.]|nr:ABC transporter permease [Ureaplasma sp.]
MKINKQNHKLNLATLNLMHKYLLKSLWGLLISLIVPVTYLLLFLAISINKDNPGFYINSIYAVLGISVLPISLLTIPAMNIEFRKSIFLRKLKLENVSRYRYNLLVFTYFFLVQLAICLINFIFYISIAAITKNMDLYSKNINIWDAIKKINYGAVFYSIFMLLTVAISFAILLSTFIKSSLLAQIISIGIIFLSLLFCGVVIQIEEWDKVTFLRYVALFSPLSQPILSINISTTINFINLQTWDFSLNNLFDFSSNVVLVKDRIIFQNWFKPLFIFLPIIYSSLFLVFGIRNFNFSSR